MLFEGWIQCSGCGLLLGLGRIVRMTACSYLPLLDTHSQSSTQVGWLQADPIRAHSLHNTVHSAYAFCQQMTNTYHFHETWRLRPKVFIPFQNCQSTGWSTSSKVFHSNPETVYGWIMQFYNFRELCEKSCLWLCDCVRPTCEPKLIKWSLILFPQWDLITKCK